ncbi:hypothetical protein [Chryseobacterium sp. 5_R23647]|uniref:hypothetical protein n=1 Tax=Chryseobacterium sp. 5_R23647 TaxID=2258964 RepID=UPI003977C525
MENITTKTIDTTKIVYPILFMISFSHFLNDLIQSTIPSLYPILKGEFSLSFAQIGITHWYFNLLLQFYSHLLEFIPIKNQIQDLWRLGWDYQWQDYFC